MNINKQIRTKNYLKKHFNHNFKSVKLSLSPYNQDHHNHLLLLYIYAYQKILTINDCYTITITSYV